MQCVLCQKELLEERAELFNTCKECSPQTKRRGFMEFTDGVAPELVMFDPADKNTTHLMEQAFRVQSC